MVFISNTKASCEHSKPSLNTKTPTTTFSHISTMSRRNGKEQKKSQQPNTSPSFCVTCHHRKREIVFLPCGHRITCSVCADAMDNCAICGKLILGTCVDHNI